MFAAPPADARPLDATLHLREAAAAVPGQRFIVRRMSPKTVLGGGTIGIPAGADADAVHDADIGAVRNAIASRGLAATTAEEIASAANVTLERSEEILAGEAAAERVWTLGRPAAYVDAAAAEALLTRVLASLARREARDALAARRDVAVAGARTRCR